jgi:very-short-patch-repair endonuclease
MALGGVAFGALGQVEARAMDEQADGRTPVVSGRRVRGDKAERAKQLRRTMTTAERILWQSLRDNQVMGLHFRRQQVISGFIVDFYCHAARLVVELDGAVHHETGAYDSARDEVIEAQGLLVLRFTNDQVMTARTAVLAQIANTCAQRQSASIRVPPPLAGEGDRG